MASTFSGGRQIAAWLPFTTIGRSISFGLLTIASISLSSSLSDSLSSSLLLLSSFLNQPLSKPKIGSSSQERNSNASSKEK